MFGILSIVGENLERPVNNTFFVLLIHDSNVVTALDLGRRTISKIKQNLFWAFAYDTGLIPIAGGILVPILERRDTWLAFYVT